MRYDLKIVNGTLVDGSGAPPRAANLAVAGGRIVELGDCPGAATETIDAEGAIVTPGFVDLHCHYDGQVSWDPDLAPSSIHGVTTAVMGSCGVGFAPVREADREALIRLMEGVEDIPGSALAEGLRWRWESFPEYMAGVDDFPHAIDFGTQITHDALRVYVMGERGLAGEAATDEEIARMRDLVREALVAGATGFSTGRTDNHRSANGAWTPAADSSQRELQGIAQAFHGLGHGVLQAVSDFDMERSPERFDGEFDLLEAMVAAAGGHPLSISLMQRDLIPTQWRQIIARAEQANARGIPIRLQVAPRGIGVILGLELTFHPLIAFPTYQRIARLPLPERVQRLRDPAIRAQLLAEPPVQVAGDGSPIPPLADRLLANLDQLAFRIFRLGERPNYEPTLADSIGAAARARGTSAREALLDALLEDEGTELLYFPIYNYGARSLDDVQTMLHHPLALPGLSDGGAHVGTICDASFPTFLLMHWVRDRAKGRIPLERAVKMLTHDTASFLGLHDRGLLAPGKKADVNVIDLANLAVGRPQVVSDLPAGGKRLLQFASGYRATIVSGEIIARDSRLTGRRPGRLVRAGRGPRRD